MSVQCTSGPARVLAHGEVTTFFGHDLDLRVELPEGPFTVRFSFSPGEEPAVRTEQNAAGIALHLSGFDDRPGRGSARPVLLGERAGDLWFLHFRVFRWGRTDDHTVHYTLFRVPKDEVGFQPTPPEAP